MRSSVAFLVATSNSAELLPRLFYSLFALSLSDVSIYIQDNQSTDNTIDVINYFKRMAPYSVFYESSPDSGIYNAWNKLVAKCTSDWFIFIGSDDIVMPSMEFFVRQICSLPAHSPFNLITSHMFISSKLSLSKRVGQPFSTSSLRLNMPLANSSCAYHRSLFESACFDETFRIAGDYDFICKNRCSIRPLHISLVSSYMDSSGVSSVQINRVYRETSYIIRRYFGLLAALIYSIRFSASFVRSKIK